LNSVKRGHGCLPPRAPYIIIIIIIIIIIMNVRQFSRIEHAVEKNLELFYDRSNPVALYQYSNILVSL